MVSLFYEIKTDAEEHFSRISFPYASITVCVSLALYMCAVVVFVGEMEGENDTQLDYICTVSLFVLPILLVICTFLGASTHTHTQTTMHYYVWWNGFKVIWFCNIYV